MAESVVEGHLPQRAARHFWIPLLAIITLPAIFSYGNLVSSFPPSLQLDVSSPIDDFATEFSQSLKFLLRPTAAFFNAVVATINGGLLSLPWLFVVCAAVWISRSIAGLSVALLAGTTLLLAGVLQLWEPTLETLSLMVLAVLFSVAFGIPIGILAAKSDKFNVCSKPILDAMQTLPTFVYLTPIIILFGIGTTSALVATVIYAIPPLIRLTNEGIRRVPPGMTEAGKAFGSTNSQLLWKVELPLARPTIILGLNQTVMMALGMVVMVALIGAKGLGEEIWAAMRQLQIGRSFEGGLVVVFFAITFDRLI